uniref:Uncharacterized protein n=1 Tax=Anguilla anguilla TaxID=7936 RepID=A0A0E9Q847_ANGAN
MSQGLHSLAFMDTLEWMLVDVCVPAASCLCGLDILVLTCNTSFMALIYIMIMPLQVVWQTTIQPIVYIFATPNS